WMASSDLDVVRLAVNQQVGFTACRSKLAEVVEKVMKAGLIRLGWTLERTHDLDHLLDEFIARGSDLTQVVEPLCDSLAEAYFSDRYPGFDLDDPDWPVLQQNLETVGKILATVQERFVKK